MPALVILLGILGVIALALIGPVFSIWSLNVLFGLAIPVTLKTYFSALWLNMVVYGAAAAASKK